MKFTKFLIIVLIIHAGLFAQNFQSDHFTIEKLADGVYAAIHKTGGYAICNAGIVDLGDETLVFDCFISPRAARDLKKIAEELTGNSVRYLVNSHYHNDHIRGNQVFTGARIIATQLTKELIEKNEPEELEWEKQVVDKRIESTQHKLSEETDPHNIEEHKMWLGYYKAIKESFGEYKTTLPDFLIQDSLRLKGNKREVLMLSKGKGHTESDMIMWLPKERILFTGDLLFVENHPWLGDGFISEWIDYLKYLKELSPQKIVPGHGPIGTTKQVDLMIGYIDKVMKIVDKAIENKLNEDELAAIKIPEEYSKWFLSIFFTPNVVMQYKVKTGTKTDTE